MKEALSDVQQLSIGDAKSSGLSDQRLEIARRGLIGADVLRGEHAGELDTED